MYYEEYKLKRIKKGGGGVGGGGVYDLGSGDLWGVFVGGVLVFVGFFWGGSV
jgi:hypothetical protein